MRSWTPSNHPEVVFIFFLLACLASAEYSELAQAKKKIFSAGLARLGLNRKWDIPDELVSGLQGSGVSKVGSAEAQQ